MITGLGSLGKLLIMLGGILILAGLFLTFFNRIKLPGDVYIQRKNFTFYFPLASSLLISLVLSFILWLCSKR